MQDVAMEEAESQREAAEVARAYQISEAAVTNNVEDGAFRAAPPFNMLQNRIMVENLEVFKGAEDAQDDPWTGAREDEFIRQRLEEATIYDEEEGSDEEYWDQGQHTGGWNDLLETL